MSDHVETVKRAIEFKKPEYLPMEINQVPGIYNAYYTLDPSSVELIPGTESFDAIWPQGYSWVTKETGKSESGESIRKDQFGNLIKIPRNMNATYDFLGSVLKGKDSLDGYKFPDIEDLDRHFKNFGDIVKSRYPDRFLNCYIDAGFYLTTYFMIGTTDFFIDVATNISFVMDVYEQVVEYYKKMVLKYKQAGAHMITVIEDLGTNSGLAINPKTWVKEFKPVLKGFFSFVHEQGLYTSLCVDGNAEPLHEHLVDMGVDVFFMPDIETTGITKVRQNLKGKICLKAPVDMKTTLSNGTPQQVEKAAMEIVDALNDKSGGFICEVVKWYRPEYPMQNVLASVKGFNNYRSHALGK